MTIENDIRLHIEDIAKETDWLISIIIKKLMQS